jgi:N-acetylglucosaminyldiphosphoundecaprenol N-acetyl-beta-D-mannosaminyltransferase
LSPLESFRVLGCRVDRVNLTETLQEVRFFLESGAPHQIVTANTLMILAAQNDAELRHVIENAALVVLESWGVRWAGRVRGSPLAEFIPGIDLMLALCEMAPTAFLVGSAPGVAEEAARVLQGRFPGLSLVGTHHGYFSPSETQAVIAHIHEARPSFLFVGMGMPAQEKWIAKNLAALGVPVVMGVGGSFDVLSGRLARAPAWMRSLGAEWAYRLVQEPWRWRRIAQLPVFMWKVLKEK